MDSVDDRAEADDTKAIEAPGANDAPEANDANGANDANEAQDAAYCRAIEDHLCRRNGGHLVRIVGPSFEHVLGWAARGIPLKIAFEGIDRHVDRALARGPRRRPARAEFCEADVLDVFDEWRRALGLPATVMTAIAVGKAGRDAGPTDRGQGAVPILSVGPASRPADAVGPASLPASDPSMGPASLPASASVAREAEAGYATETRKVPLARHIERVTARLLALRGRSDVPERLDTAIARVLDDLDAEHGGAKGVRGEARARLVGALERADEALTAAARGACESGTLAMLRREAETEVAPYRARMPEDAFGRVVSAATDRLLRQHFSLPTIRVDA